MAKYLSKQNWISTNNYLPYCDTDLLVNYNQETKNVLTLTESFEFVVQKMFHTVNGWQFNKCNNIKYWTIIPDLPNKNQM